MRGGHPGNALVDPPACAVAHRSSYLGGSSGQSSNTAGPAIRLSSVAPPAQAGRSADPAACQTTWWMHHGVVHPPNPLILASCRVGTAHHGLRVRPGTV